MTPQHAPICGARGAHSLDKIKFPDLQHFAPGKPGVLDDGGLRNLAEVVELIRRSGGTQLVQADGAVSAATRDRFVDAGAGALVVGYPIFSCDDFGQAIADLAMEKGVRA